MCLKQTQALVAFDNTNHVIFNGKAKFTIEQSTSRKMKLDQSNDPILRKLKNMALNVNQLTRKKLIYNKSWQNDILNCNFLIHLVGCWT
jgi:hypothetical protein